MIKDIQDFHDLHQPHQAPERDAGEDAENVDEHEDERGFGGLGVHHDFLAVTGGAVLHRKGVLAEECPGRGRCQNDKANDPRADAGGATGGVITVAA